MKLPYLLRHFCLRDGSVAFMLIAYPIEPAHTGHVGSPPNSM